MTLADIIKMYLTPVQRQMMMFALELGTTRYIEYLPGYFVGVNIPHSSDFVIIYEHNGWSAGRLKK